VIAERGIMPSTIQISINEDFGVTDNEAGRWVESEEMVTNSGPYPFYSVEILPPSVPQSFWKGLRDCLEGRHVDMDQALQEPPPGP
jgi:hypothetical protein